MDWLLYEFLLGIAADASKDSGAGWPVLILLCGAPFVILASGVLSAFGAAHIARQRPEPAPVSRGGYGTLLLAFIVGGAVVMLLTGVL